AVTSQRQRRGSARDYSETSNRVARMERSAIRDRSPPRREQSRISRSLSSVAHSRDPVAPSGLRSLQLIPEQSDKQSTRPLLRWGWWRSLLRLLLELRLRRRPRRTRRCLLRLRRTLCGRRRGRRLRRIGLRADDGLIGAFAVGQPDVVDRVLDAMQAGACSVHPAREDPLHLALQRDLVDLDKGVGVGGFRRWPRVAGTGLHTQRAELHGLADILVEIDDAAGDLVEAGEARLLVGDLGGRRLGHDLVTRLQRRRRLRHALGWRLALARWRVGDARLRLARLRRLSGNARLRALGRDGCSRRRRQRLRLEASRRRSALPRRRTVRGRQQAAARQFRHFLVVVGEWLLRLVTARNG